MQKSAVFLIGICLLLPSLVLAQQNIIPCYTDEMWQQELKAHPEIEQKRLQMEQQRIELNNAPFKRRTDRCDTRIIPTVVHIIHNNGSENISDATVHALIKEVNDAWRFRNTSIDQVDELWQDVVVDMQVELQLAKYDENGQETSGIIRVQNSLTSAANNNVKTLSRWPSDRYLNIWIVRNIDIGITQGTVLGFAYFPWMESTLNSGIVIRSDVLGGNTLPHELGHYLDLYHPFQDGCGSDCSTTGDRVCDTPPSTSNSNACNLNTNTCSNDNPNVRDMIENIMAYSSCRTIFTKGQKARVDNTFNIARKKLVSIENQISTGVLDSNLQIGAPVAEFEFNTFEICEGETVSFFDRSCTNISNSEYKWFFPSGTPSAAFDRNPKVAYNRPGLHDVTLIVSNNVGVDTIVKKGLIRVIPAVAEIKSPYIFDFESIDHFPTSGWAVTTDAKDVNWQITKTAGKSGVQSLMLPNFNQNNSGKTFTFSLPEVDFTTAKNYELSFDLAYTPISNDHIGEELSVYAKNGCDGFNILRFFERGNTLRTANPKADGDFIPKETEWKRFFIDMRSFQKSTSLNVSFTFKANVGNNLYIDNINLGGYPLSIETATENLEWQLSVFPNPNFGQFNVNITSPNNSKIDMLVINILGQPVYSQSSVNLREGRQTLNFEVPNLKAGLYYVVVKTYDQTMQYPVFIQ